MSGQGPEVPPLPRPRGRRLWAFVLALGVVAIVFTAMLPQEKVFVMPAHWKVDPQAVREAAKALREHRSPAAAASSAATAATSASSASSAPTAPSTVDLAAPMPAFAVPPNESKK